MQEIVGTLFFPLKTIFPRSEEPYFKSAQIVVVIMTPISEPNNFVPQLTINSIFYFDAKL